MLSYGLPVVVALNRFSTDTAAEIAVVEKLCKQKGVEFALSEVFEKGSAGGLALAEKVVQACEKPVSFQFAYRDEQTIIQKIEAVAKKIYGAAQVAFTASARKQLQAIEALGDEYAAYPVCMAKTQYSLSDDPTALGRPSGFTLTVRELKLCAGAKFIVALTGDIMTMPGLSKTPAAMKIDIDSAGHIQGLF